MYQLRIFPDLSALCRAAAEEFTATVIDAAEKRGRCSVLLSGGVTPNGMYRMLATDPAFRTRLPWHKIHFFWGDERHVPPDDPQSNYRTAFQAMLSLAPVEETNIHRIPAELKRAEVVATQYEATIRANFQSAEHGIPVFDLALLGIGPDGHTASLFPNSPALQEQKKLVAANWVDKMGVFRITVTLPVLNNAEKLLFLVSGTDKAAALQSVLEGASKDGPPARSVQPVHGSVIWFVDQAAAARLSGRTA